MRVLALILLATLLGVSNSFAGVYLSEEEIQAADRRMNEKADADAKRGRELAGQQRAPAARPGDIPTQEKHQSDLDVSVEEYEALGKKLGRYGRKHYLQGANKVMTVEEYQALGKKLGPYGRTRYLKDVYGIGEDDPIKVRCVNC